jgi:hypothetical protein
VVGAIGRHRTIKPPDRREKVIPMPRGADILPATRRAIGHGWAGRPAVLSRASGSIGGGGHAVQLELVALRHQVTVSCNFPPQATLLPSRRWAVSIIAMSVEPRNIGEATRYLSRPSITPN